MTTPTIYQGIMNSADASVSVNNVQIMEYLSS